MKLPLPFLLFAIASAVTHGQVIISEISSDNSKYEDEETDTPDWIELHNTGDSAVDLDGWQLTTSESAETAWTIRDLIIEPMAVRLLFASGKDRPGTAEANVTYRPHTSFTLENGGGYLALLDPSQAVADAIQYPSLTKNETFGSKGGTDGYYFPGTPNSINIGNPSPLGLAPSVVFSHEGGLISENIELILSVPDHPEAEIQYALDGGEPSLFSPSYNGPITIDRTQTITARALLPDHLPSRLRSQGFILLDETLTSFSETGQPFESNLPIIVIDTFGINVDNTREFKYAYASVVSPTAETPQSAASTPSMPVSVGFTSAAKARPALVTKVTPSNFEKLMATTKTPVC